MLNLMNATLPDQDIVLLGAGHTHGHIIRMWRMSPPRNVRLTCISNFSVATYSGMLPGTLAGLYDREQMEIDLVRLCASAGVRFLRAGIRGLDIERREVLLEDRPPVPFDVLSIGIGSIPSGLDDVQTDANGLGNNAVVAIKPMQTFLQRLDRRLLDAVRQVGERPPRIAVVGAGVAGVEITLALTPHVVKLLGATPQLMLIDRHDSIAHGLNDGAVKRVEHELRGREVEIILGHDVRAVGDGELELSDGRRMSADIVLWATGAEAPPLLRKLGLPTDTSGFLLTEPTLQTVAGAPIFVVGDSGTIERDRTPKAGVYAVRQGPILWKNLQRRLKGQPLEAYRPQHSFLKLLSTGDGRSILDYKGFSATGHWCWKLKNRIDTRFMAKFQDYQPMSIEHGPTDAAEAKNNAMRCAGCGGKVGGDVLRRVLERLDVPASDRVLVGLDQPDDAAVLRQPDGRPVLLTTDFFASFVDDPYLVGRIAALNAASDIFALGGRPVAALAMATLPLGPPRQQEQLLFEMLAGSLQEFRNMNATLAGGHTIEGPRTMLGYTVVGDAPVGGASLKSGLRPGDVLVLTKPLGTGVLLAAQMQAQCRAAWYESLVESMLISNQLPEDVLQDHGIGAITDVTGFGLAGHLLEMLNASGVAAEISLAQIPLLPGTLELLGQGIASTLAPANRTVEAEMQAGTAIRNQTNYAALFDPQTSGGLLLGVPEQHVDNLIGRIEQQTSWSPVVIGRVMEKSPENQKLDVV